MKALDRKLFRDLARLKGQVLTIALVLACGVASYVTLVGTFAAIERARASYYEGQRFPDVFAALERAPRSLEPRVATLPGVAEASTRIVSPALVPLSTLTEPATASVVSLPREGGPRLGDVRVTRGRLPVAGRGVEALVLESFADAHGLVPGDAMPVVLGGVRHTLRLVGTAVSPEWIFAVGGATMVQDKSRFAVVWMNEEALAPAVAMDGAFNEVLARLEPNASERATLDALDALLARYGGLGAHGRAKHPSHMMLTQELGQLESYATVAPILFLSVAAFLVHVVISRTVALQRTQIAVLKAVGYSSREVAAHYVKLVSVIAALGALVGVLLGLVLGRGMLEMYRPYFHIPMMTFRLEVRDAAVAMVVAVGAAIGGTLTTVRGVAKLPPAEAMTPASPTTYRRSLLEAIGLTSLFGTSARMVTRELGRHPARTAASVLGVAFAIAVMVVARFSEDGVVALVEAQFEVGRREDLEVSFRTAVPVAVASELRRLPGVLEVELHRAVPVRVRSGHKSRDAVLSAAPSDATLGRIVEWPLRTVALPHDGVLLSRFLAEVLDVRAGGEVQLEPLEGDRRPRAVPVAGVVDDVFGLSAYATEATTARVLGAEPTATSALLTVDPALEGELTARLERLPTLAAITRRRALIDRFNEQVSDMMTATTAVLTGFAAAIAVGIIYNNARIALSMRARDLASLRVLGFTRREISAVLLGELAAYIVLAIAPGLALGRGLCVLMMTTVDRELYRFPTIVSARTYAFAVVVTAATALVSALLVRRKLDRLDLVAVLKTRE